MIKRLSSLVSTKAVTTLLLYSTVLLTMWNFSQVSLSNLTFSACCTLTWSKYSNFRCVCPILISSSSLAFLCVKTLRCRFRLAASVFIDEGCNRESFVLYYARRRPPRRMFGVYVLAWSTASRPGKGATGRFLPWVVARMVLFSLYSC